MLLQNIQNYNLHLKMKAEMSFMNIRGLMSALSKS